METSRLNWTKRVQGSECLKSWPSLGCFRSRLGGRMQKLTLFLVLGYCVGPLVLVLGSSSVTFLLRKIEGPQGKQQPPHALSVETAMIICTNLNRNITGEMLCTAWGQAPSDTAFSVVPSLDAAARAQLSAAQPLRSSQGPGPPAVLVVAG